MNTNTVNTEFDFMDQRLWDYRDCTRSVFSDLFVLGLDPNRRAINLLTLRGGSTTFSDIINFVVELWVSLRALRGEK